MEFVRHNQKLASTFSIATIILILVFNLLYYIFAPIQSQGDPPNFVATPIIENPVQATPGAMVAEPQQSPISLISLSILLVIVLLIIVIIFAVLKYFSVQQHQRDKKRKQDLQRIAQALEAYHQEHGQYPLSSTYQPQYYTGINLSNDWNYYGLPNKEHMVRYLPDWPISDPSIDYHAKHQVNQYIYYPKENGQKFFLYAHLEAPSKDEQIDYNKQDNLLRSWGAYNYRVNSGQEQPSAVQQIPHPQHTKPTAPDPTPTAHPAAALTPASTAIPTPPAVDQPQDVLPSTSALPTSPEVAPAIPQATPQSSLEPTITTPATAVSPQPETLTPQPNMTNQPVPAINLVEETPAVEAPPTPQPIVTNIQPSQPTQIPAMQPTNAEQAAQEPVIAAMPPIDQPAINSSQPAPDTNTNSD